MSERYSGPISTLLVNLTCRGIDRVRFRLSKCFCTCQRHDQIVPTIKNGKRVLIAAHGNSIRAVVKYLDNVSDNDIVELNIPTGLE